MERPPALSRIAAVIRLYSPSASRRPVSEIGRSRQFARAHQQGRSREAGERLRHADARVLDNMRLSGQHVFEQRAVSQIRDGNISIVPDPCAQRQCSWLAGEQARKKPAGDGQHANAFMLALERKNMRRLRAAAAESGISAVAKQQCKLLPDRENAPAEPELCLAV